LSTPYPWTDLDATWYAALVSGGTTYAVARRTPTPTSVAYEVWNPRTRQWRPTKEGLAYFTGIGGITDAEPIDEETALRLLESLGTTDNVSP
jgi:hypothetical protein